MMPSVRVSRNWRVDCRTAVDVPLAATAVWGQMRDLRTFATLDPFHHAVEFEGGFPRPCVAIRIVHRFGPIQLVRVGRVLRWNDGRGYVFSDLSASSVTTGFPHVYEYAVTPLSRGAARLSVHVRGRWTATWIPRAMVWMWLSGVMLMVKSILQIELHSLYRRLKRRHGVAQFGDAR